MPAQHDHPEESAPGRRPDPPRRQPLLPPACRETSSEMNTTLSMPSTISIALSAMKARPDIADRSATRACGWRLDRAECERWAGVE